METVKTKDKLEKLQMTTKELKVLAEDLQLETIARKRLVIAATDVILASDDYICEGLIEELKQGKECISRELQDIGEGIAKDGESVEATEREADAVIEEVVAEPETTEEQGVESERGKEYVKIGVERIEKEFEGWRPPFQEKILQELQSRQPQRTAEYEAEEARDEARDDFLDYCLNNLSESEETQLYKKLLAEVEAGKLSVPDAA